MENFWEAYQFVANDPERLWTALQQHLLLVSIPMSIGLASSLPLGYLSSRSPLAATVLINGFNGLRVIPSLAVLFLAIPYLGLTFQAAALALTILVVPPLLIGTDVAFRSVNPAVKEAARGMGMTQFLLLRRIEIPLALPLILAAIKTATVEAIASATLAAFIGAGGLGSFVTLGFALYDISILLVGAIPVALLALLAELGLSWLQRAVQPQLS
ncbi:MAG: ABC transporter permease [Cyanobacteria bacterium P01_E01_bin.45]